MQYRNNPEIARFQGWKSPLSREEALEFIASQEALTLSTTTDWMQIAIEHKAQKLHIGDIAVKPDFPQAEIGITLATEFHHQGYASEALNAILELLFVKYHYHRVVAIADVENIASLSLLERVGMRREGHMFQSFFDTKTEEWRDEYQYAILSTEYLTRVT